MASDGDEPETTTLPPNEAFAALGNDTRMSILQTLGAADGPLSFSELRDRIGMGDSGQFNYHLSRLAGHFVRQTDEGYELQQAGSRVVEAVLSGAVTETVILDPTRLETPCPYCGADIEVSYREERLLVRCTECAGSFGDVESTSAAFGTLPEGAVTLNYLPSAGFQGRTPQELLDASFAWTLSEAVLVANGICPRCSGVSDHAVDICADHDPDGDICEQCHTRFAVLFHSSCTNCNYDRKGGFNLYLFGKTPVRAFFEARGIDPLAPGGPDRASLTDYQEEILSTDPFEAQFTFRVADDELVVTVDDDLDLISATERQAPQTDR